MTSIAKEWENVIQHARKSICEFNRSVFLHIDLYDPEVNNGSGFYVHDKEGFVLTNKHVVGPAPCFGFMVFEGNFELEILRVAYTDPELDFAIVQVDADRARDHGIRAIPLAAEGARLGVELCCLGNNEKMGLSIGRATITRTDTDPHYRHKADCLRLFNCEMIQAAFSAVGGSSRCPALNIEGQAVGLMMAGQTKGSGNFLLPLHYPQMVIEKLTAGTTIPRGTIQVQWTLQALHESKRYGLPASCVQLDNFIQLWLLVVLIFALLTNELMYRPCPESRL